MTSRPSGRLTSRAMLRLLRFFCSKAGGATFPPLAPAVWWKPRSGSPVRGSSILTTSAPQSARIAAPPGSAAHVASSMTFTPRNGFAMVRSSLRAPAQRFA